MTYAIYVIASFYGVSASILLPFRKEGSQYSSCFRTLLHGFNFFEAVIVRLFSIII